MANVTVLILFIPIMVAILWLYLFLAGAFYVGAIKFFHWNVRLIKRLWDAL